MRRRQRLRYQTSCKSNTSKRTNYRSKSNLGMLPFTLVTIAHSYLDCYTPGNTEEPYFLQLLQNFLINFKLLIAVTSF